MLKYKLTKEQNEQGLYRIQALKDIPRYGIKAGDLGGWVQSTDNLSQKGSCWVSNNGRIYDSGRVSGNGLVSNSGCVAERGHVYDNGQVLGQGLLLGNGQVFGNGILSGNGWIDKDMKLTGTALVIDGLSRHCITVADAGMVSIGCEVHHIDTWLTRAKTIGKEHSYSARQIAEYLSMLKCIKFMIDNYRQTTHNKGLTPG